ncbi:MAG TPA: TIGR03619 family F420-dependent LLM class oxidoreductase [Acidimicrobiales bacterium]|nr:TIGR03619 family F420-dependent LLM class oxidoreductase [Acidimicrobiales bacterium]
MRVGIVTPVLTRVPKSHGKWEVDAGIEEVARIAATADALGYDYVTCSEHVGIPVDVAPVRGAVYWDPAATLGYLAARTSTIRLATHVLVLGYHHPLELAKTYGTLDRISGGRVVLGVGVGSLKEEFELLDVPFDDRGARADDALRALRASLAKREPAYEGPYYRYRGMVVDPWAVQEHMPIWIGGRTRRSLRRAAELADGWMPFGLTLDELQRMVNTVELPAGFELALSNDRALDPAGAPDRVEEVIGQMAAAGTTVVNARIVGHSLDHYLEQLEALAGLSVFTPSKGGAA